MVRSMQRPEWDGRGEDRIESDIGEVLYYGWDHHGVIMELLVATRTRALSSFVRLVGWPWVAETRHCFESFLPGTRFEYN